jgi:hypothetical protein
VRGRLAASLLVVLGAAPTLLAAQASSTPTPGATSGPAPAPAPAPVLRTHALGFGFVATLGANWQIESLEFGYVRRPSRGLAAIGLSGRLGTFVNESTMLGGNQGVVFAATLSARTHMRSVAQLGSDEHGTGIGFDMTFELTGYAAAGSPVHFGSRWIGVSALPAFSVGNGDAPHFAIVIGPTAFFTANRPVMRGLLAFRGEAPLARRERHP